MRAKTLPRKIYKKVNLWKRAFQNVSFEEVIKPIFRGFIEPLLKNQSLTPREMMRLWFDVDYREVYFGEVKREVSIPGHARDPDTHHPYIPEAKARTAFKGDQVVVRFDSLKPGIVEVEFDDTVFSMTAEQWFSVRGAIALVG